MNVIYIYHHLGLGDHIICNSIIRYYSKLYDKIFLFVKECNQKNVSFMFRDLNNVEYIIGDDFFINKYIIDNNIKNLIKIGFDKLDNRLNFDRSFYEQINLPFEYKWELFNVKRNFEKEKYVFDKFNLKENEYIFVHDDKSRNFEINKDLLKDNLKIITPTIEFDFFDFCYIIENAKEIHLMESSFKCLVEHLKLNTSKLYYHTYIRNYPKNIRVTSKYNWIEY